MLVLYSNQNNAQAKDTEVCPTLPASMGMGGGYVPMIVIGVDLYNQTLTGGGIEDLECDTQRLRPHPSSDNQRG